MTRPVFDRDGNEVGEFDGQSVLTKSGPNWALQDGSFYDEGDEGGISLKGQLMGDAIVGLTGELRYSIGSPIDAE